MCAIVVAAAGGPRLGLPACDDDVCGGNDDGTVVDGRWGCGWMGEYRPDPEIMGSRMRIQHAAATPNAARIFLRGGWRGDGIDSISII